MHSASLTSQPFPLLSTGGDDFKSGQTKMKSVLVDFLVGAGIKPTSIVSYNHLGNNDGMNLSAPQVGCGRVGADFLRGKGCRHALCQCWVLCLCRLATACRCPVPARELPSCTP